MLNVAVRARNRSQKRSASSRAVCTASWCLFSWLCEFCPPEATKEEILKPGNRSSPEVRSLTFALVESGAPTKLPKSWLRAGINIKGGGALLRMHIGLIVVGCCVFPTRICQWDSFRSYDNARDKPWNPRKNGRLEIFSGWAPAGHEVMNLGTHILPHCCS